MTEQREKPRDWDRSQWAGGSATADRDADPKDSPTRPAGEEHWNKTEWVGDQGHGTRPAPQAPEDMPEGAPGLSGLRHNPGTQHWVPDKKQERPDK
jgi:hypothetical protein